jgi:hypothetical protein
MSNMPWSPTPGSSHLLAFGVDDCFDFHLFNNVVLPTRIITGLNPFNLSAYGLSARYPTLKTLCYHKASKDSLPGGWPTFRDGIHTRWTTRPCPAALKIHPKYRDLYEHGQICIFSLFFHLILKFFLLCHSIFSCAGPKVCFAGLKICLVGIGHKLHILANVAWQHE